MVATDFVGQLKGFPVGAMTSTQQSTRHRVSAQENTRCACVHVQSLGEAKLAN